MFRLLTNARIHDGANGPEIAGKMATLPAPPIRSIAPHLSPAIAAIVDRSLQFKKEDRYPNAASMRAEVRAARKLMAETSAAAAAAAKLERQSTILDGVAPASADPSPPAPLVAGPTPISKPVRRAPPAQVPARREGVAAGSASKRAEPNAPRARGKEREKEKKSSVLALIALGWVLLVAAVGTVVFVVRGRLIGQHDETGFGDDAASGDGAIDDGDRAADSLSDEASSVVTIGTSGSTATSASSDDQDAGDVESLDEALEEDASASGDAPIDANASPSGTAQKPAWNGKTPIKKKPVGTNIKKKKPK